MRTLRQRGCLALRGLGSASQAWNWHFRPLAHTAGAQCCFISLFQTLKPFSEHAGGKAPPVPGAPADPGQVLPALAADGSPRHGRARGGTKVPPADFNPTAAPAHEFKGARQVNTELNAAETEARQQPPLCLPAVKIFTRMGVHTEGRSES